MSAIKNILIRAGKYSPKREVVFVPAGGVKGVAGIAGIISSKEDELPIVLLDSDKSGEDYRKKLETGLYANNKECIIFVGSFTNKQNAEIEDIIPYEFISRTVDKLIEGNDEDDEFEEDNP